MVEMQWWIWNKRNVFMNIDKLTYKMKILFTCVVCIGMTAGCNDAYEQQSTDNEASSLISVHTTVDSKVGEDNAERAQLLFWDEETFHGAWIEKKGTLASPWFVSTLDNEIDYYSKKTGIAFNTKQEYPTDNDATIHATGYYPAVALSPIDGNYSKLQVQDGYLTGKIDFMTCDGCVDHSASRDDPFTNSDKDKELKFRHLMACIIFRGERDESMENIVGVKNVKITVYNESELYVPKKFNLYTINSETNSEDKSTYIIGGYSSAPDEISIHYPGIINMGEQRELGACYVVSPGLNYENPQENYYVDPFGADYNAKGDTKKPRIKIKVTADFYSVSAGESASTTETWDNLIIEGNDWKNSNTGDKFIPGYMYDILLHFNRSGVTVKAEAVPWEDGGIHVHPVQPKTNP